MIQADQPTCFPATIKAAVSSVSDGTMKQTETNAELVKHNRNAFLTQSGLSADRMVVPRVSYDTHDFLRYRLLDDVHASYVPDCDGLATNKLDVTILLPLADCTGAMLYDPVNHAMMVSHLGRHSTEQLGGTRSVEFMTDQFGTNPADLLVWLSPSPGVEAYPLHAFHDKGFREVIRAQLLDAGVRAGHIEQSDRDTATSADYFSHSEFLKGNRTTDGRYAIAAMLQ